MKQALSERNVVVILFFMVLITFSFAQEDSKKKLTKIYSGIVTEKNSQLLSFTGIQAKQVIKDPENTTVLPR